MPQKEINRILKSTYGCNLWDQQIFRVSFSDNETEKRFGDFNEFYGKIFIRSFKGIREVPKYPHLHGVWVLERWFPSVTVYTPEIPGSTQGSYEPVFVFEADNGVLLQVTEEACKRVIAALFNPPLPGHRASLLRTEDEDALKKETEYHRLVLEDQGRSWIGHRLSSKEGIIVL